MVPSSAFGSWSVGQLELCTSGPQFSLCGSAHRTFWDFSSRTHMTCGKRGNPRFIAHILSWTWSVLTEHVKELILRKFS